MVLSYCGNKPDKNFCAHSKIEYNARGFVLCNLCCEICTNTRGLRARLLLAKCLKLLCVTYPKASAT